MRHRFSVISTAMVVAHLALLFASSEAGAQIGQGEASQHVVVVLDDSGSMNEPMQNQAMTRMTAAKQSLNVVLQSLPETAHVGVVLLNAKSNGGQNWIVPLGPVDKQTATAAINSIQANGGTPLGKFMKTGADSLLQARGKDHYGSYRLLIVTDGEAGDKNRVEKFLPDILSRGITTDVIGVDMKSDHSLATKVHTYRRADNPESLTQAVREVFAETSTDTGDAGEDDFDLVSGLPDAVAAAALEALAASGNHPIGTQASVLGTGMGLGNSNADSNTTTGSASTQSNFPNNRGNRRNARNNGKRGINKFIIVIGLVVLFNIIKAVTRGGRRDDHRQTRRRR